MLWIDDRNDLSASGQMFLSTALVMFHYIVFKYARQAQLSAIFAIIFSLLFPAHTAIFVAKKLLFFQSISSFIELQIAFEFDILIARHICFTLRLQSMSISISPYGAYANFLVMVIFESHPIYVQIN